MNEWTTNQKSMFHGQVVSFKTIQDFPKIIVDEFSYHFVLLVDWYICWQFVANLAVSSTSQLSLLTFLSTSNEMINNEVRFWENLKFGFRIFSRIFSWSFDFKSAKLLTKHPFMFRFWTSEEKVEFLKVNEFPKSKSKQSFWSNMNSIHRPSWLFVTTTETSPQKYLIRRFKLTYHSLSGATEFASLQVFLNI